MTLKQVVSRSIFQDEILMLPVFRKRLTESLEFRGYGFFRKFGLP